MADLEVERLRRLRGSALRLRAVARALTDNKRIGGGAVLQRGRLVAWRVARTTSGWLRAHPYVGYQRDVGVATVLANSVVAAATSLVASNRQHALHQFGVRVRAVLHEMDDARALTRCADLSDSFGRLQHEFRALLAAVDHEFRPAGNAVPMSNTAHIHEGSRFLTI